MEVPVSADLSRTDAFANSLSPSGREAILKVATRRVFNLIQGHFRQYALTHHASADRLGAKHTKHMERAARDMSHEANADRGLIHLSMAGIGRAFHDVTIRPVNVRWLTIPVARDSYGKRARDFEGRGIFVFRSKNGNMFLARTKGRRKNRRLEPLFLLKKEVHQKQDATMLPRESEIRRTGRTAIRQELERQTWGSAG